MTIEEQELEKLRERVRSGGAERYHAANAARGKIGRAHV